MNKKLKIIYKYSKAPPLFFASHHHLPNPSLSSFFLAFSLLCAAHATYTLYLVDVILPTILTKKKTHQPLQKRKQLQEGTMVYTSIPAYIDPANWQQQVIKGFLQNLFFFS